MVGGGWVALRTALHRAFWPSPFSSRALDLGPFRPFISSGRLSFDPFLRPLLPNRPSGPPPPHGSLGTCMSDSKGEVDLDSLTLAIEQLHLATGSLARAVRGPPAAGTDDWVVVPSESQPGPSASRNPRPEPAAKVAPSSKDPSPDPDAEASSTPRFRFRPPPVHSDTGPESLLHLVVGLAPAVRRERAQRAWDAGLQARQLLSGAQAFPDATPPLQVRSRFYVVLRNGRGGEPACYHSFASFKRDVGPLAGSDTVCHGFPTQGEGQIYAAAAGVPLPRILP